MKEKAFVHLILYKNLYDKYWDYDQYIVLFFLFFLDGSGIETMNTEYEQHEKVCKAYFQTQIIIIHSDVLFIHKS